MRRIAFFLFLLLLTAASCSSKKKLVTPMAHADYQWMSAKMTMDVSAQGVELNNVSGVLRMRRDSAVWISASALMGMESIRTLVTKDSVVLVNRMDQTYLAEPVAVMAERYPGVSLQVLQSKLLGNGSDHVEIQYGPFKAKIRYTDIQWNVPATFPIKINKNYERIKL